MGAPVGSSAPSKGELIEIRDRLNELVSHGILLTTDAVSSVLTTLNNEILAR